MIRIFVFLSEMWDFRGVCYHSDCRWQVYCLGLWESPVPYSNDIILKTKIFFFVICPISWIFRKFWSFWKKKMIVIANVSPILQIVKGFIRPLSKKYRFASSFDNQHVKTSETVVKSPWEHFYDIFSSLWGEIISTMSFFHEVEFLGVYVNTLTVDHKYTV